VEGAVTIRACVESVSERLPSLSLVRFSFWFSSDGVVRAMEVLPDDEGFRRCLAPFLSSVTYAPIARSSQRAQVVVRFAEARTEDLDPDLAWWSPYVIPGDDEAEGLAPWWHPPPVEATEDHPSPTDEFDRWWLPTAPISEESAD
jgi:hypothetical protein